MRVGGRRGVLPRRLFFCCMVSPMRYWRATATVLFIAWAGCGAASRPRSPSDGVRAWITALRSDNPRVAYDLLSEAVQREVRFSDFAEHWRANGKERQWQAQTLEAALRGDPDVGQVARTTFSDGRILQLTREGGQWRLGVPLVAHARARSPREAIAVLAAAVQHQDLNSALGILTQPKRSTFAMQLRGLARGLANHHRWEIDSVGQDRAELRWDDGGVRYRIVLMYVEGEWLVDDIHIRPQPKAPEVEDDE